MSADLESVRLAVFGVLLTHAEWPICWVGPHEHDGLLICTDDGDEFVLRFERVSVAPPVIPPPRDLDAEARHIEGSQLGGLVSAERAVYRRPLMAELAAVEYDVFLTGRAERDEATEAARERGA